MEIYRFETARFVVTLKAEPEDMSPEDSFQFQEDIDYANSGDPAAWFCTICEVREKQSGAIIGRDVLGGCSYLSFDDFVSSHRTSPYESRNTLATKARNTVYCYYFPSMVAQAIAEARETISRLCAA